jgi:hypothetical protein
MWIVRRGLRPEAFKIRIASIITADDTLLSVAPVPELPRIDMVAVPTPYVARTAFPPAGRAELLLP